MKKRFRKITASLLMTIMIVMTTTVGVVSVKAYSIPDEGGFISRINSLRQSYPNGGTWSNTYYENGIAKAWQCHGYACQMMYEVFGAQYYNDGLYAKADYNMGTVNAGDLVRINGDGHSIFVTKVTNERIYFTDANWDYNNGIRWDASYTISELRSRFTYKVHIPGSNLNGNGITDTSAPTISNARAENVSGNSFDIKCDLADNVGVTRLWMIVYGPAGEKQFEVPASSGSFSYTIRTSDHGGAGEYAVGFYAYDAAGNATKCVVEPIYAGARFKAADAVNLGNDFIAEISYIKCGKKVAADNNDNVIVKSIDGSDSQKWHFTRNADGSYRITNCQSQKCLDVAGARTENETNIQVYQSNDSVAQKWYIIEKPNGYGLVPLSCTSSTLDVYGGYTAEGTNVQQYNWNQGGAQNFSIDYISLSPSATLEYNNHKYEYYNNNTTWYQAYRTCERLGGHLVTITSNDEQNKVFELTNNYSGRIWVGLTNDGSKNWYWINNEPYTENGFWASGEPNNTNGKEKVVEMSISGANKGQWNDIAGNVSLIEGFVCEYDDIVDMNSYEPIQSTTFGGYKYDLYDDSVDWITAKKICELKGGQLTDIANETEQDIIGTLAKKGNKSAYWIGLSDVENEGIWKWCNGKSATFNNWADNEPNNSIGIESYVAITKGTGKWNDNPRYANGFSTVGFICKTKLEISPENVFEYNGHRYEYYHSRCTWYQAYLECEKLGGHLVTITSQAENNKMLELVNENTTSVWIGATRFNNSNWYWVNSEQYNEINLWTSGEPNNTNGNENVVNLYTKGAFKGGWNDIASSSTDVYGFICEYDDLIDVGKYQPSQSVVLDGYIYELYDYSVDWQTAKKICEKKGGMLVDIKNAEDQEFIWNLTKQGGKTEYWIGLTDIENRGLWNWISSHELSYNNWKQGTPDNDLGIESYGLIKKEDGTWNDLKGFAYAYHSIGFICKTQIREIGDVNGDENVDVLDAAMVQKYTVNRANLNEQQLLVADVNNDNHVDVLDAADIQKFAAGIISEFKKKV